MEHRHEKNKYELERRKMTFEMKNTMRVTETRPKTMY